MNMIHGGDIYRNHVKLDFSVNVNPLGIPVQVKQALHDAVDRCENYPDIAAEALRSAVGEMLQIPADDLLFGNGASELFMAVVHALKPKKVVIPVPSFYGYEHAAHAVTEQVLYYPMKEAGGFLPDEELLGFLDEETDLLFLANPNNPTGRLMDKEYLTRLLKHCREKQIFVVLDECFIEFCGRNNSVLTELSEWKHVILVRAFTKIFTIPGVRLGYLICSNPEVCEKIRKQIPEWNLSVFAQAAGLACTRQCDLIKQTAEYIKTEREFLKKRLEQRPDIFGKIYEGDANFLLLYSEKPLYDRLLQAGILIRNCENFRGLKRGYYRIAVRTHEENEQLWKVIGEINWNE